MADQEERLTERLMVQLSPPGIYARSKRSRTTWSAPWHGSPAGASGCTSPRSSKRRRRWPAVTTSSRRCSAGPASAARWGSKRTQGELDRRAARSSGESGLGGRTGAAGLTQRADEHRPERPILLAVDQQLGEGAALRVAPELADPVGPLEVGEHQDVEKLRVWGPTEGIEPKRSRSAEPTGFSDTQGAPRWTVRLTHAFG